MTGSQIDTIVREGGRRVAVHRVATGPGRTLVLCHAAPGAATFDPDPDQSRARGITLLSVDRPGYGQSDPVLEGEWATVSTAADDLAAVLDHMAIGPVGVAGWSAGGRVALALAARRPDLVDRVVVLCTPAPNETVAWIPPEQLQSVEALRGQPANVVHAALEEQLVSLIPDDIHSTNALTPLGASPIDDNILERPGARDRLTHMIEAAFAQGVTGVASEIAGYTLQPWGFEPQAVQAKTLLLYGSQDPVAGSRHGNWWQKHLPNARLEVVPGAGHLLIVPMWGRALSHLAPGTKQKARPNNNS